MNIAVVILNWNGKNLLQQFIPDLIRYSKEARIYLIDNGSDDDSVPFIKKKFSEINVILNQNNLGYAEGYNIGLQEINEDILCLMFNVFLQNHNIPIQVEKFEYNDDDIENQFLNNKEFQEKSQKNKKSIGLYAQKELFIILNFAIWKKVYKVQI